MAAPASQTIKKFIGDDLVPKVYDYTIRNAKKDVSATFKLLAVRSNKDPEQTALFATNLDVTDETAQSVSDKYSKRWGIETAFRVQDNFIVKTTSKNYSVRLFYFLFSICLYNLWILANIIIGLAFGFIPEKPIITSKMFAVMLYSVFAGGGSG
jgi:putative transposase